MTRGEVWLVGLDPTVADEMRKTRPAVIAGRDSVGVLALRVIVPITAWQDRFKDWDWLIRLDSDAGNGLDKSSAADTLQVRSVSTKRFIRRLGQLSSVDMARVSEGLRLVLDLQPSGNESLS